jgi:hypothetical protein
MHQPGLQTSMRADGLADILERVLDKGIVVAGDISISLVGIELLTIKVRLLVTTVDKAMELGINWWETDPMLSSRAQGLEDENRRLRGRLAILERRVAEVGA